ncbi:CadC family transcriptional regulator [Enterobacteriaceae bacterium RIT691]|nr:CadC family transcriptional regulator [Enterobacteriaceae bacterium RIT691]
MQQPVVLIGEWLVTPSVNQISRQGRQLTLEPRLIDLLVYFAHHPDEVLSRDELIDHIWTRNVVTPHVVTQSISELRKSLKDGNENSQEYIVTVPKRGYKLAAPVVWCTESGEELQPVSAAEMHAHEPSVSAPASPEDLPNDPPAQTHTRKHGTAFWVWSLFVLALGSCVALVAMSTLHTHPPVTKNRLLLNPRDIDIRLLDGNSCNNLASQRSYAIGLGSLITTSLNTFSTFMVHDKSNYNINEPSSSGKTLTIEFVNQRHYRAQQCFMSVQLVDNADGSQMMDKRYFITNDNLLSIQGDLMSSLSQALTQPWPPEMQAMLHQYQPSKSAALAQFYLAHQLLMKGDVDSLGKASDILDGVLELSPDFAYALAEKALVNVLRHSQQPLDKSKLTELYAEIDQLSKNPALKNASVFYQIKAIDLLGRGQIDDAFAAINNGIDNEMSWMNYVLLGKAYEMKGENRMAADAYITAFNLRPGENTLYWIENSVFQTSLNRVVPYLDNFLTLK